MSPDSRVQIYLKKELKKDQNYEEQNKHFNENAEWGDAFLIGPSQNIVACAEYGKYQVAFSFLLPPPFLRLCVYHSNTRWIYLGEMFFWDLESDQDTSFQSLVVKTKKEPLVVSWIGPQCEKNIPSMIAAGKELPLIIWSSRQTKHTSAELDTETLSERSQVGEKKNQQEVCPVLYTLLLLYKTVIKQLKRD